MACFLFAVLFSGIFAYLTFWRKTWREFQEERQLRGDPARYRFFTINGTIGFMYWWEGMGTYTDAAKRRNGNQMRWNLSGVGALCAFVGTITMCDAWA